ncbi:peptidoglycan editing factor PgeF [Aliiroseovarius sp.]|uniref:peptidoglycan editing factor PgeF n=1 Tax=Aliiroseovarius sp. TaxID=1872442 RepID=UPI0026083095|nr:peptidoglycan editing factor PgeF [Aliiroseovarius sp.]
MTLEAIISDAIGDLRHGFFTRKGGASSGVYAGLNCGAGSDDMAEAVAINRTRVAEAMGVAPEDLIGVHQVHSPDVVVAEGPLGNKPEADAVVTATPGLALTILTADCGPVLFADREAGVVGAAHAGWKGALDGVLEGTIEAMVGLGATREGICAVLGPTISQQNYEVGPEFLDRFLDADADNGRFFVNGVGDKYHFDLPVYCLERLRAAGVGNAEWVRHCTYANPDLFYSYRRSVHRGEPDYGRLVSAIRL